MCQLLLQRTACLRAVFSVAEDAKPQMKPFSSAAIFKQRSDGGHLNIDGIELKRETIHFPQKNRLCEHDDVAKNKDSEKTI